MKQIHAQEKKGLSNIKRRVKKMNKIIEKKGNKMTTENIENTELETFEIDESELMYVTDIPDSEGTLKIFSFDQWDSIKEMFADNLIATFLPTEDYPVTNFQHRKDPAVVQKIFDSLVRKQKAELKAKDTSKVNDNPLVNSHVDDLIKGLNTAGNIKKLLKILELKQRVNSITLYFVDGKEGIEFATTVDQPQKRNKDYFVGQDSVVSGRPIGKVWSRYNIELDSFEVELQKASREKKS